MKKLRLREVVVKYKTRKQGEIAKITSPDDALECFTRLIDDDSQEQVLAIYTNVANEVIGYSVIGKGTDCESIASTKIAYQKALLAGANGMVLMHNHPSGNIDPSEADIELTQKFIDAGKLVEVSLIDHLVVGYGNCQSIRSSNPQMFEKE